MPTDHRHVCSMAIDQSLTDIIRSLIREEIAAAAPPSEQPDLITIEDAAAICGCDRHTIMSIVHNRQAQFPAIRLGPRTFRVDRTRLYRWLASGGLLSHGEHNETR